MKEIPDQSIDMILTDPPYGVTRCQWDKIPPLEALWNEYKRIIKPNGCIAIFAGEPFSSALVQSNLKMYRYELIWKKAQATDFLNAKRKPLKIHDKIQIYYKKQPIYNPQMTSGKAYNSRGITRESECYGKMYSYEAKSGITERYPSTVLEFKREVGIHPTQKPVPLLRWLIRTYTNEGDTVLDTFAGSGSTAVAALNEKRRFICCEKEEKYFEAAKQRIEEATIKDG
jgi:DNA (cytosine-5-)-methyltransferase|nr:MAG TPA: adenine-specific methyltransferase [Siphoviridae sp. ctELO16]